MQYAGGGHNTYIHVHVIVACTMGNGGYVYSVHMFVYLHVHVYTCCMSTIHYHLDNSAKTTMPTCIIYIYIHTCYTVCAFACTCMCI